MPDILSTSRYSKLILTIFALIIIGAAVLLGFWYVNGGSVGPKSFARDFLFYLKNTPRMLLNAGKLKQMEGNRSILFVHHSVGVGFIRDGQLREMLRENGYQFWDQGYIGDQLAGPDGEKLGFSYNIPGDNTDPDGFYALFAQRLFNSPVNGFSQVMQHDVIVLKSCYPVSYIYDDAKFEEYQRYYLGIRDVMDRHPEKLFIILNQPPLNPAATDVDIARRARALAEWLVSDEFVGGRENLAVFDLFDLLAEPDQSKKDANMLREDYREWEDSHPNALANEVAAQRIAEFIVESDKRYQESY